MIPKIIHQMWLDKNVSNNSGAPEKYVKFVSSFNEYNPEFMMIFWNIDRFKKLFDDYPEIKKYKNVWHKLPIHIQKCDMARYIILYLFGGLYIDLDFMCFKNLSPIIDRNLLLVREPIEFSAKNQTKISNSFMGSIPKHPFWLEWLDFICLSLKTNQNKTSGEVSNFTNVMNTTGPANFGLFFSRSKYANIELVSTCDIIPLTYSYDGSNKIINECIHRNNNSNIISGDNYYKHFGNYTHTKWFEGSGWMNEKNNSSILRGQDNTPISSRKNNILLITFIVLFIIELVFLCCIVLFYL
jgi:hypothetical protein